MKSPACIPLMGGLLALLTALAGCQVAPSVDCQPQDLMCNPAATLLLAADAVTKEACSMSHLEAIQPENWLHVRHELESQRSLGTTGTIIGMNYGNSSAAGWLGGAVGTNGKVYGIPANSPYAILEQDTTPAATEFGSVTNIASGWAGGVLAPNGMIYGLPASNSSTVVEIDPIAQSVSEFSLGFTLGGNDYAGGVLAPNGKIYVVPNSSGTVMEIDPDTRSVITFGSIVGSCQGAVLAPTGTIICIPATATTIYEIDPETRTVSSFGTAPGGNQYIGGALAPNGKIYAVPFATATTVLEIDPENRTTNQFGVIAAGYGGAALAPNGFIYGLGVTQGNLLEIDPVNQTVAAVGSVTANNYLGVNLGGDSMLYGIPNTNTVLGRVDTGSNGKFCDTLVQAAYFNKF